MKKLLLAPLASLLFVTLLVSAPLQAATPLSSPDPAQTFTYNAKVPTDLYVYVPCAPGGQGEMLYLQGDLHILLHSTLNASGGYSYESHYQPQDLTGVGLTSGAKYQATGITRDSGHYGVLPYMFTYVNNFRMIGQAGAPNYTVHENLHITINPNGDMTAYVDNYKIECK